MELSDEEFQKSGADKTAGLRANLKLIRLHMGWLVKRMMSSAPPFYYDNSFSKADRKEILDSLGKARTYETALSEYAGGHDLKALAGLLEETETPMAPLTLVTHDSQLSIREIQQFGGAAQEQAGKIETLWQEIMGAYLTCAGKGERIWAEHSSHYIYLTDSDLVCKLVGAE